MTQLTFHLIGNAHLDPVWMWDWREGMNEGIITHRTILDLMDEDGELTFMRGEAVQYEHLERHAPDLFERVVAGKATSAPTHADALALFDKTIAGLGGRTTTPRRTVSGAQWRLGEATSAARTVASRTKDRAG